MLAVSDSGPVKGLTKAFLRKASLLKSTLDREENINKFISLLPWTLELIIFQDLLCKYYCHMPLLCLSICKTPVNCFCVLQLRKHLLQHIRDYSKAVCARKCFILPSVELSQKQELAVCRPAPFFCMMIQVTEGKHKYWLLRPTSEHRLQRPVISEAAHHIPIYLKGFPSLLSWLRHCSTTLVLHWFTLLCW